MNLEQKTYFILNLYLPITATSPQRALSGSTAERLSLNLYSLLQSKLQALKGRKSESQN